MTTLKITSYADLKKIPLGTEMTMTHNIRGPQNEKRRLSAIKPKVAVFDILEGPNVGQKSELPLNQTGVLFEEVPQGFRISFNGGGYLEYKFN